MSRSLGEVFRWLDLRWRAPGPATRFVIIGDVGGESTYHVGDEAMLEANLARLREDIPGASFTAVSDDPNRTAAYYGVRSVPRLGFPTGRSGWLGSYDELLARAMRCVGDINGSKPGRAAGIPSTKHAGLPTPLEDRLSGGFTERCLDMLEALKASDGLIISGGGNLCSTWPHLLYERIALMQMAKELGKRVVVLGQTLGPHLTPNERQLLSDALRATELIVVRERPSYDLAISMGVPPEKVLYSLDDAFYMPNRPIDLVGTLGGLIRQGQPWIAVTFAAFVDPRRHSSEIESLAEQLGAVRERTGAALVFIPHAADAEGSFADEAVARRLLEHLGDSFVVVDLRTASEVRWLTQKASLVISNRYHPLVFASSAGVPCLGIYSDDYTQVKIQGALQHVGLQEWCLSIERTLSGDLKTRALELWTQREQLHARLLADAPRRREQYDERSRRVAAALTG